LSLAILVTMASGTKPALNWLIACDESGISGHRYYGFGSIWMRWERRGDFARVFQRIREEHEFHHEAKWNRVKPATLSFYEAIVEEFFRRRWITFHCLIVRKAVVDRDMHGGDYDLARRKHFTMLLTNKIQRCLKKRPKRQQTFRIWVDPIASRYAKADEAVEVIANNVLGAVFGNVRPVDSVITHDSKLTPAIQLADLLIGATMSAYQGKVKAPAKLTLAAHVAKHLGWDDLAADTQPGAVKFNVWYFHDRKLGKREITTRSLQLLYPIK